ncbi:hypothetical protein ACWD3J_13905 [Streptomyces sp. NPDC002755]
MYSHDQFVTDVCFWRQIRGDAKRTVICEPHIRDELQQTVERQGLDDILTVRGSLACPEGMLILIDEGAFEAANRAMIQNFRNDPWGRHQPRLG